MVFFSTPIDKVNNEVEFFYYRILQSKEISESDPNFYNNCRNLLATNKKCQRSICQRSLIKKYKFLKTFL